MERLRALREKRGLSQGKAAKQMGIVRTTYSNYEAGNREPDFATIKKIAEFFEVSIDYLLGKSDSQSINGQETSTVSADYASLPQEEKRLVDELIRTLIKKRS